MLPYLNDYSTKTAKQIVAFRGINYGDMMTVGDLQESLNLSARRYPFLSTRRGRVQQSQYTGATAMTARDKLVVVQGTNLLYDGQVVGTVTAGEKQFAVVNTRMVIWPDKVYLDLNTLTVKPLGAAISGSGATFTTNSVTVSGWGSLTEKFKVGDTITVSGCATASNNKDVSIKAITANSITVSDNAFTAATETGTVSFERKIPDLDYICESGNRLWGCSTAAQSIYASALGDPTNFFTYDGLSTDSYAVAVGSGGKFTGCCKLSSSVLFWKETTLHKMMGSYPAEYAMYPYEIEGLQDGCYKSLQVINEILYYKGLHGVYSYSGGVPALISTNFGSREFTEAVGGNDGDSYFLSARDANGWHLMVYETVSGLWMHEDNTEVLDFARIGKDLYFLDGSGKVWLADGGQDDPNIEWTAHFCPFEESVEGRKMWSKLLMRVELPVGAWMQTHVRYDGGRWLECGKKIVGKEQDSIPLLFPINRCDRFELRLDGHGPCTIRAMLLEYSMGSDV